MTILATAFKALGDPTRLRIVRYLACCPRAAIGPDGEVYSREGPDAGEVCCRITGKETITSTVSFHLKELREAGVIHMTRKGKRMICALEPQVLTALGGFLSSIDAQSPSPECC